MSGLAGAFVGAALLLGLGAALEVRRPAATVGALRAMGVYASPAAVRLGALVAVVAATGAVVWMSRPFALAVSASYVLLGGFVLAALRRDVPIKTCGCFGSEDTPPTIGHVVVDLVAALVAALVGLAPGSRGWGSVPLDANAVVVSLFVILAAAATAFAYLALTALPRLTPDNDRSGKA